MKDFILYFKTLPPEVSLIVIWVLMILVILLYRNFSGDIKEVKNFSEEARRKMDKIQKMSNDMNELKGFVNSIENRQIEIESLLKKTYTELKEVVEEMRRESDKVIQFVKLFIGFKNKDIF